MRKALRCCRFPLIILKRWEQRAECVSSCRNPLMMVLRDKLIACCKLYDIFIPATAFIFERIESKKNLEYQAIVDKVAVLEIQQKSNKSKIHM